MGLCIFNGRLDISVSKTQVGRPVKVVATGGLAGLFHQRSDLFYAVDTDLTLDGLAMLAGKVAAKLKVKYEKDFTRKRSFFFLLLVAPVKSV